MRLKLRVELIFACLFGLVSLEQNYSSAFITRSEVVSRLIEFDS